MIANFEASPEFFRVLSHRRTCHGIIRSRRCITRINVLPPLSDADSEVCLGAALSTLRFHDILEITEIAGEPDIPLHLGNLKRLELNMGAFLAPAGGPYYSVPWLSALPNLEALKVVQRSRGEQDVDIMGAFYPQTYPKLHWLHFENMRTSWNVWWDFLFVHRHTLTYLKVLNPNCEPSVWSQVRAPLECSSVFNKLLGGTCDLYL